MNRNEQGGRGVKNWKFRTNILFEWSHISNKWMIPIFHFSNIWWNTIKVGGKSSFSKKACKLTMLLSVVLSVRHLSNSQNSSRLSYYVSLNEVLSLSVGLLPCLSHLLSLSEDGALCTEILREKFLNYPNEKNTSWC